MEWSKKREEEWNLLNNQLQRVLTLEVNLRQEILSNLSQQEYVLLIGDLELKEELHRGCQKFAKQLQLHAKKRNIIIRKMSDFLPVSDRLDSFEDLFSSTREDEAETLLLYKKLLSLTEKIQGQKIRNKTLYALIQKEGNLDKNNPSLHARPIYTEERPKKQLLITIDYPDNEISKDPQDDT